MNESTRYTGKPLLRLLECYALKAIGELSLAHEKTLAALAPKLGVTYARVGTWDEILVAEMDLPAHLPALILQLWRRNQEIATAKGVQLSPQQFAEMFVDQNLWIRPNTNPDEAG